MDRSFYTNLGNSNLRMPVGADLILHEKSDPQAILTDGVALGKVIEETANRFKTPLAVPHMDLELEKHCILEMLGIPKEKIPTYQFDTAPSDEMIAEVKTKLQQGVNPKLQAHAESVKYIAENTDLLPIGMSIGPFSLMSKMAKDPITPIYLAGMGTTSEEDETVLLVEQLMKLSVTFVLASIENQIKMGAKAIFIAEPAANKVYFSPNQLDAGSDVFERYAMKYNLMVKECLNKHNVDLIFHCCGELTEYMVKQFTTLDPAILSLGSSRCLWEDAKIVPNTTVLYGNLPSKKFYSDSVITVDDVQKLARELVTKMKEANHAFILGTECDVLSVKDCEQVIMSKCLALMNA